MNHPSTITYYCVNMFNMYRHYVIIISITSHRSYHHDSIIVKQHLIIQSFSGTLSADMMII